MTGGVKLHLKLKLGEMNLPLNACLLQEDGIYASTALVYAEREITNKDTRKQALGHKNTMMSFMKEYIN